MCSMPLVWANFGKSPLVSLGVGELNQAGLLFVLAAPAGATQDSSLCVSVQC